MGLEESLTEFKLELRVEASSVTTGPQIIHMYMLKPFIPLLLDDIERCHMQANKYVLSTLNSIYIFNQSKVTVSDESW